jgi:hypothetical protein
MTVLCLAEFVYILSADIYIFHYLFDLDLTQNK